MASKFNIKQGEKVIKLKFLRAADKQPMMIERTYLPYEKFSTLTIEQLTQNSLYLIMKANFHQTVRIVNEAIQASLIQAKDAKLLKVSCDAPCLKVKEHLLITDTFPLNILIALRVVINLFITIITYIKKKMKLAKAKSQLLVNWLLK